MTNVTSKCKTMKKDVVLFEKLQKGGLFVFASCPEELCVKVGDRSFLLIEQEQIIERCNLDSVCYLVRELHLDYIVNV
jgi:hypothetical protein